jgi:hypothetical protein
VQQIAGSAYADYRDNAFKYVEEHFDYKNFICEFNARISDIVDANVKK